MSRRRNPAAQFALREYVEVDVVCTQKHLVGHVFKTLISDEGESPYGFEVGSVLRFEDDAPTADSGRVVGRCSDAEHRDDVRVRWDRVRALLDELDAAGRSRGEIGPNVG